MKDIELWLAPLHGITNSYFRNTLCRHFGGIDFLMSPFIAVQTKQTFNKNVWFDIFSENNPYLQLIPQLMGNNPTEFVETMQLLNEHFGYQSFNINIGCPSSKVLRHHRGCALLSDTQRIVSIIETIITNTDFHISLKMRLGLHNPQEGLALLSKINDFPLDFLIIHPRIGTNLYSGTPDLDSFELFLNSTHHKIIYSGDIFTTSDFNELQQRFPSVHAWMLGRGILRNPFLAEDIKGLTKGDKYLRFADYYDDYANILLEIRTKNGALSQLKELWHYFACFFNLSQQTLNNLLRINDFDDFYARSQEIISLAR